MVRYRDAFGHEDVRFAGAVGVWHDADDDIAAFLVEFVGVAAQVADCGDVLPDVGVEIDAAETGQAVFVIRRSVTCIIPGTTGG